MSEVFVSDRPVSCRVDDRPPRCSDFDEDCEDIPDKVHCYLYDPLRGFCPYLSANPQARKSTE
jgi:hypothetical protein